MAEGRKEQTNTKKGNQNEIASADGSIKCICIPVSEWAFKAFLHFGCKYDWFRTIANKTKYTNGCLCLEDLTLENVRIIENKVVNLLLCVKMMSSDNIEIPWDHFDIDFKKKIKEIELQKPNVCVIINYKEIQIISENYMDLLEAKYLIQQIWSRRVNRRAGRTFAKLEESNDS